MLFFFRHMYFSELNSGIRQHAEQRFKLLQVYVSGSGKTRHSIVDCITINTLSFMIRYLYLNFMHSFFVAKTIKQRWLSQTFFLFMLRSLSTKYVSHSFLVLLRKNSVRATFLDFVNGYVHNRSSRLLSILDKTYNSTFFLF